MQIPLVLSACAMVLMFVAIFVITFVIIIQQFHKELLGDCGYLYFTLPVKSSNLIWSKVIVNMVYMVFSGITGLLSIFIVFCSEIIKYWSGPYGIFNLGYYSLRNAVRELTQSNIELWQLLLMIGVIAIVATAAQILMIYFSIALGNLSNKNKGGMSFVAYFAIYMFWQIFNGVVMVIFATLNPDYIAKGDFNFYLIMGFVFVYALVQASIYFIGTNWIFKKRLNLA